MISDYLCNVFTLSITRMTALVLIRTTPLHHNHFTAFFRDHPGQPVPEENFWALWCKGRLTEADTPTVVGRHSIRTNHGASGPPSNTWFPGPTQVLNPNGISIGAGVFAGLTSDRPTDTQTDHATRSVTIDPIYVHSTCEAA